MIQKSTDFDIDLNTKSLKDKTAFHFACEKGQSKIAEMLIQKSSDFNTDLNTEHFGGRLLFIWLARMVA